MKIDHTPNTLTQASLAELTSFTGRPCLSLYQPSHRRHPDNQQDPLRLRHRAKALEASLRQPHAASAFKDLLGPFEPLAEDRDFWHHTPDGLAVLGAPGLFCVFLLKRPFTDLADSFTRSTAMPSASSVRLTGPCWNTTRARPACPCCRRACLNTTTCSARSATTRSRWPAA